jgi:hypothetical protein
MQIQRLHPATAITALFLVTAVATHFFTVDRGGRISAYLAGSLVLASPFVVLLVGHLAPARTWRRNAFLAGGNVLFAFGWAAASLAMRWLQPGWVGLAFFGAVLALFAGLYVLLALVIPEKPSEQAV